MKKLIKLKSESEFLYYSSYDDKITVIITTKTKSFITMAATSYTFYPHCASFALCFYYYCACCFKKSTGLQ